LNKFKSAFATFAIIFLKELKHAFRDKDVLIYTIVVPAVLYPLLLVCGIELFVIKQEADTKEVINYAVKDGTKEKIKTVDSILTLSKHYKRVETTNGRADLFSGRISFILDEVKASPKVWQPKGKENTQGKINSQEAINTQDKINTRDSTRVEATVLRSALDVKVVEALNSELDVNYKKALNDAFKAKGFGPAAVEVNKVQHKNINVQKKEMFSIGLALVFFSLFNVALGAAYPAIAATSEEFERNTIEATLMLPLNRWFMLTAKLAAVVSLALLAGSLNLASMYGDSSLALMGTESIKGVDAFRPDFKLTLTQAPCVVLAYLAVAVLYASVLMMTAAFCRTVRSSQQWISLPLTIFIFLPFLALVPQLDLTYATAFIPVLGNILALRSLFNGDHLNLLHLITFVQALILIAVSMKIASILVFERFEGKWRF
jgi:sodium transport system permease protein